MSFVDLEDYKLAIGETDAANDDAHQAALTAAEVAVLNWTDRDFDSDPVTEDRTYWYNGGGVLEIDDASAVSACSFSPWEARRDGPVAVTAYSWLRLPSLDTRNVSGEMGFTRNLDLFIQRLTGRDDIEVTVTATWGWPGDVPADVIRATIWTAAAFEAVTPSGGGLASGIIQSESVAEVARQYATANDINLLEGDALPGKAAAILWQYRRHVL